MVFVKVRRGAAGRPRLVLELILRHIDLLEKFPAG